MDEFNHLYKEKPELSKKERKGHISITILSIIIFALTFSLIIDDYCIILSLVAVLLFHELGHYLTMKKFGYKNLKMLFIPFMGAMVQGNKKYYSQKESTIMLFAGPVPGILLGFLCLHVGIGYENHWLIQIGTLFFLINLFNLLPIEPLDGGQLMRVLFAKYTDIIQLVLTFLASLILIALGWWFEAWIIVFFGFFIGFKVKTLYRKHLIRNELRKQSISYVSRYENLSNEVYYSIKNVLFIHIPILKKIQEETEENHFDQLMANQVNNVLIPPLKKDISGIHRMAFILLWIVLFVAAFLFIFNLEINIIRDAFQSR